MMSTIKTENNGNSGACADVGEGESPRADELLGKVRVADGASELVEVGDDACVEVGVDVGVPVDALGPTTMFALIVVQGISL